MRAYERKPDRGLQETEPVPCRVFDARFQFCRASFGDPLNTVLVASPSLPSQTMSSQMTRKPHSLLSSQPMPTHNCKRRPPATRRPALELLAASRDGRTEAVMIAHGFTVQQIVDLVLS